MTDNALNQRNFYRRMKDRGLKKVSVYVPAKYVGLLTEYAETLRETHKAMESVKQGDNGQNVCKVP